MRDTGAINSERKIKIMMNDIREKRTRTTPSNSSLVLSPNYLMKLKSKQ